MPYHQLLSEISRILAVVVAIPMIRQLEITIGDIIIGRSINMAFAAGSMMHLILPSLLLWFAVPRFIPRLLRNNEAISGWPLLGSGYLLVGLTVVCFVINDIIGLAVSIYFAYTGDFINYILVFSVKFAVILVNLAIGIGLIFIFRKREILL